MNTLENAIADVMSSVQPGLESAIREAKAAGASKSQLVKLVTRTANKSVLVKNSALLLVDKIWEEPE